MKIANLRIDWTTQEDWVSKKKIKPGISSIATPSAPPLLARGGVGGGPFIITSSQDSLLNMGHVTFRYLFSPFLNFLIAHS